VSGLVLGFVVSARPAVAADSCNWISDDLPLPLPVKTPRDLTFKAAAERQYLIFNLLAGGKLAWQRGDFGTAVQKWETLLRTPGIDPQIEKAVAPFLAEAREKSGLPAGKSSPTETTDAQHPPEGAPVSGEEDVGVGGSQAESVSGTVFGGGQIGPGGAVVWLRRTDGRMPRIVSVKRFMTQRDKAFIPHVLAVPTGSTVEFKNEDRIYHNVFSLAKPNDFDASVRAAGSAYSRKFDHPGAVDLLCNIHAAMNAFIYVVDSPFFAKTRETGAFSIPHVPPGQYEIFAWHEASSKIAHKRIAVVPGAPTKVTMTVGGDKAPGPFVPDKYGHKRQAHLGY
jgi:plastocyanin